jgi:hypothetical protein
LSKNNANTRHHSAGIIGEMFAVLGNLYITHPDYYAWFDHASMDTASSAELVDLMQSAPNDQVKFYILGTLCTRIAFVSIIEK